MLLKRKYTDEIMDDFSINYPLLKGALKELKIINTFLGGLSTTLSGLKIIKNNYPQNNPIKVLDIGAGSSDVLLSVDKSKYPLKIYSLDANPNICKYLKEDNLSVEIICADVNQLPFSEKHFDVLHASLFLHHFKEEDIVRLLNSLKTVGAEYMLINDLRRSILALAGIKLLTSLFSKNIMIKNDAPLSVKRAFVKSELVEILNKLGFEYSIKRKWAFRWLILIDLKTKK